MRDSPVCRALPARAGQHGAGCLLESRDLAEPAGRKHTLRMARCRARTQNGTGPLGRNPVNEAGMRCHQHKGLPEASPRLPQPAQSSRPRRVQGGASPPRWPAAVRHGPGSGSANAPARSRPTAPMSRIPAGPGSHPGLRHRAVRVVPDRLARPNPTAAPRATYIRTGFRIPGSRGTQPPTARIRLAPRSETSRSPAAVTARPNASNPALTAGTPLAGKSRPVPPIV